MPREDLERDFPRLVGTNYEPKSKHTIVYNCASFAIGFEGNYMWPISHGPYAWKGERVLSLKNVRLEFEGYGFQSCGNNDSFEDGVIKIAIYTDDDGLPTHIARQNPEHKMWVSKCGDKEDIIHELEALNGSEPAYGRASLFMRIDAKAFDALHEDFADTRKHQDSSEQPMDYDF